MELRNLSSFLSVAKTLSFTRAAQELNYSQSTVTAQIQTLERELGSPLFERLGKRVSLTESGRRLVRYAEKMIGLEREALAVVPGGAEPAESSPSVPASGFAAIWSRVRSARCARVTRGSN